MKKIVGLLFVLICFVWGSNEVQANTGLSNMTYAQCVAFQDPARRTAGSGNFNHCMRATCFTGTWQTQFYISSNMVTCTNGNNNMYLRRVTNGCSGFTGSCPATQIARYCGVVYFFDCTRTRNGQPFTTIPPLVNRIVTFNTNGGTPANFNQTVANNTRVTQPVNPTRANHTFNGWVQGNNCNATRFNFNTLITSNITLTACWTATTTPPTTASTVRTTTTTTRAGGGTTTTTTTTTPGTQPTLSDNNFLASLTVNPGQINFNRLTESYTLIIEEGTTSIEVIAVAEDEIAEIVINNYEDIDVNIPITITVIAENGDIRIYTINLSYEGEVVSNNSRIRNIIIAGHNLNFSPDIFTYDLRIGSETSLDITILTDDEMAQYRIVGNFDLQNRNRIEIIVTAEDGSESTYIINLQRSSTSNIFGIIIVIIVLLIAIFVGYKVVKTLLLNNKKESESQYEYE